MDKTLLNRTFVRGTCEDSTVLDTPVSNIKESKLELTGLEARKFYESVISSVPSKKACVSDSISFRCAVCGAMFEDRSTATSHLTSIAHQVAELKNYPERPSPLLIPSSNKGYQLLTKIGWTDETKNKDFSGDESSHTVLDCENRKSKTNGGLGANGQGRRHPIATVLKRDRLGLGWPSNKCPRITHFGPGDSKAVENHKLHKSILSKQIKLDSKFLYRRNKYEKKMERNLRLEFNLPEEQLAILRHFNN